MEMLRRVGERNKNNWFVLAFGASIGVPLWLIMRSLNPFAWAVVGLDSFVCMLWMVPIIVLARFIGAPIMQDQASLFYFLVGGFFVLGLISLYQDIKYMDRNEGRLRPMFRAPRK